MREIIRVEGNDNKPYHVKVTRSLKEDKPCEEIAVNFCLTESELERLVNHLVGLFPQFSPENEGKEFACFSIAFDITPEDGLALFMDRIRRI